MPIADAENNSITFMPHEMVDLPYLKPGEKHKPLELVAMGLAEEKSLATGQKYDHKEMRQFTFSLMEKLMINYRSIGSGRKLDSFTEEDKVKLRPFACFLAMIDGNAFRDLIDQYIPEAYALITSDGRSDLDSQLENMKLS